MQSMLIENGEAFDASAGAFARRNVAVADGRIVDPASLSEFETVVDASGCLVLPGLVDFHLHAFADGCDGGVDADAACLPNGVTTAVDGGSCGESNYGIFHNYHVVRSAVRMKAFLNVSPAGLSSTRFPEVLDPSTFSEERIRFVAEKYPGEIVALKVRVSKGLVPDGDETTLRAALEIAESVGLPLVAHATDPALPSEAIAGMLRAGDVFCHALHGSGDTIIDSAGRVKKGIREARDRGVLFDACHGRVNFALKTARAAIADGFLPDILSTDFSPKTLYRQPVVSLPSLMSKFLALGCSLPQAIAMVARNPARFLGLESELATLDPGTVADIAVFKLTEQAVIFRDWLGDTLAGNRLLAPKLTVRGGRILYRAVDM